MEDLFLKKITLYGYSVTNINTPRDLRNVVPMAIQCFKSSSLKYLSTRTNIPLVQLIGISDEYPTPQVSPIVLIINMQKFQVEFFILFFNLSLSIMKPYWTKL
jgi:hypothetical protein